MLFKGRELWGTLPWALQSNREIWPLTRPNHRVNGASLKHRAQIHILLWKNWFHKKTKLLALRFVHYYWQQDLLGMRKYNMCTKWLQEDGICKLKNGRVKRLKACRLYCIQWEHDSALPISQGLFLKNCNCVNIFRLWEREGLSQHFRV